MFGDADSPQSKAIATAPQVGGDIVFSKRALKFIAAVLHALIGVEPTYCCGYLNKLEKVLL